MAEETSPKTSKKAETATEKRARVLAEYHAETNPAKRKAIRESNSDVLGHISAANDAH